jgi:hypothetical protein
VKPCLLVPVAALFLLQGCASTSRVGQHTADHLRSRPVGRTEPNAHLVGLVALPWQRADSVDHGHKLRVFYFGGATRCGGLKKVRVLDRKRSVEVTLFEGHDPGANYCPLAMVHQSMVDVRLHHPLGKRNLVDGAD